MKRFRFLIVLLLMSICTLRLCYAEDLSREIHRDLSSLVSIEEQHNGSWRRVGSGVVVRVINPSYFETHSQVYVLSAKHVLKDLPLIKTRACSAIDLMQCVLLTSYRGGRGESAVNDWALSSVDSIPKVMRPARVRESGLRLGQRLIIAGFPWRGLFVSEGICMHIDPHGDKFIYVGSGLAAPGSSGGGVFDSQNRLVGIVVGIGLKPGYDKELYFQHQMVYILPSEYVEWRPPRPPLSVKQRPL